MTTNLRQIAADRTRADLIAAAKILWSVPSQYAKCGIRVVAKKAGYSAGALYAQFASKADLYRAAFHRPAPDECPIALAAHDLFRILQNLIDSRPEAIGPVTLPIERDWLEAEATIERIKDQLLDYAPADTATGAIRALAA